MPVGITAKATLVSSLSVLVLNYWGKKLLLTKSNKSRTIIQWLAHFLQTENISVLFVPAMCILSLGSSFLHRQSSIIARSLLRLAIITGYPVAVLQMFEVHGPQTPVTY